MFDCVLYLTKIEDKGKYDYFARANTGNQRNAKNRFNLEPIIKDISYDSIIKQINKNIGGKE